MIKLSLAVLLGLCIILSFCVLANASVALSENTSNPEYWVGKGSDLVDDGKYIEAARYYSKAISILENNNTKLDYPKEYYIGILHARGMAYFHAEEYKKADHDLLTAANSENQINKTRASDYYLEAAIANYNIGYRDSAYNMLIGSAIRANSKNANAWYLRGMYFTSLNKYKQAAEYFSKARELGYDREVTREEEETIERTAPIE